MIKWKSSDHEPDLPCCPHPVVPLVIKARTEELPAKYEKMRRQCEALETRVTGYESERAAILSQTASDIAKMSEKLLKYKSIYEYEKVSDDFITS